MNTEHTLENKFKIFKKLFKIALVGAPFVIAAFYIQNETAKLTCTVIGIITVVPFFIFAYVLTLFHWKSRYRGSHSDLWGVLLLIETSGWFKLVYLFRHILPDINGSGRYAPMQTASKSIKADT